MVARVIKSNPGWVPDTYKAIDTGLHQALAEWNDDKAQIAMLLMKMYMERKGRWDMQPAEEAQVIQLLSKYFNLPK